jgi:hypothetical protein
MYIGVPSSGTRLADSFLAGTRWAFIIRIRRVRLEALAVTMLHRFNFMYQQTLRHDGTMIATSGSVYAGYAL